MDGTFHNIATAAAALGSGLAIGLGAIGPGLGLGRVAHAAMRGIVRQPAVDGALLKNMLVGQAVTETPAIFSLVVALMLYACSRDAGELAHSPAAAAAYLSAGLCMGLGALGAGVGSGMVAGGGLDGMARTPSQRGGLLVYMLMGQAWVQTGAIFALVIALSMLGAGGLDVLDAAATAEKSGRFLGAACAMGFGAIGPSLGTAHAGAWFCTALAEAPKNQGRLRNAFFLAAATAQSPSIYALVIALVLVMG